ncbi:endoribonuclease L-PSP [Serratia marcescens subsp. marcescens ATCC 13880]|nr:endoribonuclease L-PSP [Serratia marcescens subsp. marcescens ATCC 13880]
MPPAKASTSRHWFLTDIADLAGVRPVLFDYFDGALPACSLMAVSALFSPAVCVEIEAVMALQ